MLTAWVARETRFCRGCGVGMSGEWVVRRDWRVRCLGDIGDVGDVGVRGLLVVVERDVSKVARWR
jgi:hypothetical protein